MLLYRFCALRKRFTFSITQRDAKDKMLMLHFSYRSEPASIFIIFNDIPRKGCLPAPDRTSLSEGGRRFPRFHPRAK
jgi:hypothetical protein